MQTTIQGIQMGIEKYVSDNQYPLTERKHISCFRLSSINQNPEHSAVVKATGYTQPVSFPVTGPRVPGSIFTSVEVQQFDIN